MLGALLWAVFVFALGYGAALGTFWWAKRNGLLRSPQDRVMDERAAVAASPQALPLPEFGEAAAAADAASHQHVASGWFRMVTQYAHDEVPDDRRSPWLYAVLQANVLTLSTSEEGGRRTVVHIDGCRVDVMPSDLSPSRRWLKKYPLAIRRRPGDERPLTRTSRAVFLYAQTGRLKEDWYYRLRRGANLANPAFLVSDNTARDAAARHFAAVRRLVGTDAAGEFVNADWANALAARVFWGLYGAEPFLAHIRQKIERKIGYAKLPKIVKGVTLREVSVGPNIPVGRRVSLKALRPNGQVEVDAEFEYSGGFSIAVDVAVSISLKLTSIDFGLRLAFKVESMSGRVMILVPPPPSTRWWLGFYERPEMNVSVETAFGDGINLPNLPEVSALVADQLKAEIAEILLLPEMDDSPLPHLGDDVLEDVPVWIPVGSSSGGNRAASTAATAATATTPGPASVTPSDSGADDRANAEATTPSGGSGAAAITGGTADVFDFANIKRLMTSSSSASSSGSAPGLRQRIKNRFRAATGRGNAPTTAAAESATETAGSQSPLSASAAVAVAVAAERPSPFDRPSDAESSASGDPFGTDGLFP